MNKIIECLCSDKGLFFFAMVLLWLLVVAIIYTVFNIAVEAWKLLMRRHNIREHGWPPAYLDASGDSVALREASKEDSDTDPFWEHLTEVAKLKAQAKQDS